MRKLRMLMMMGCIPMILGAEEYKAFPPSGETLETFPIKDGNSLRSEKASGFLQKFPEQYIRI